MSKFVSKNHFLCYLFCFLVLSNFSLVSCQLSGMQFNWRLKSALQLKTKCVLQKVTFFFYLSTFVCSVDPTWGKTGQGTPTWKIHEFQTIKVLVSPWLSTYLKSIMRTSLFINFDDWYFSIFILPTVSKSNKKSDNWNLALWYFKCGQLCKKIIL